MEDAHGLVVMKTSMVASIGTTQIFSAKSIQHMGTFNYPLALTTAIEKGEEGTAKIDCNRMADVIKRERRFGVVNVPKEYVLAFDMWQTLRTSSRRISSSLPHLVRGLEYFLRCVELKSLVPLHRNAEPSSLLPTITSTHAKFRVNYQRLEKLGTSKAAESLFGYVAYRRSPRSHLRRCSGRSRGDGLCLRSS